MMGVGPNETLAPGGAFLIDPTTGAIVAHILPQVFFRDLAASPDGLFLYGVQDWPESSGVRFMRIDARTGVVLSEQTLHPVVGPDTLIEEWSLAYAALPTDFYRAERCSSCPAARCIGRRASPRPAARRAIRARLRRRFDDGSVVAPRRSRYGTMLALDRPQWSESLRLASAVGRPKMQPQSVVSRVDRLERRVDSLEALPGQVAHLELLFLELRDEMRAGFSALRAEMGTEVGASGPKCRREMRACALRFAQETRRLAT